MITWKRSVMALPAVGVSLLPKLACPICWPAYAGVLTALGLGFLTSQPYLLWVTVTFLMVCMGSLILRAQERRGYGPAAFGIVAGAVVLAGKFHFESNAAMYSGLLLLIGASIWNSWPRRAQTSSSYHASDAGPLIHLNEKESKS